MARSSAASPVDQNKNVLNALTGILPRLEHSLFSADGSRTLRTSPYERTKVGAVGNSTMCMTRLQDTATDEYI